MVQVYASTEDSSLMIKDEFILKFQEMVWRVALGDDVRGVIQMQLRVRDDRSIWGDVLGSHEEEVCTENGRRLFSSEHNLLISNTLFPHKRIHKYTWELRQ